MEVDVVESPVETKALSTIIREERKTSVILCKPYQLDSFCDEQQPQNGEDYEYHQMKKPTEKHKSGQHRQQFNTEQELHQEDGEGFEYNQMKRSSKKPKCERPLQTDRLDEEYL